jgi:hypothetical protein
LRGWPESGIAGNLSGYWTGADEAGILFIQENYPMAEMDVNEISPTHPVLRALGWVSVGVSIAAVGILVGTELRKRYQFNHRTPYDFYSNAGSQASTEFGVGV